MSPLVIIVTVAAALAALFSPAWWPWGEMPGLVALCLFNLLIGAGVGAVLNRLAFLDSPPK